MQILNKTYRLRISQDDKNILYELKRLGYKPTTFIREAFREKVEKDLPKIIQEEKNKKELEYIPF